MTMVNVGKAPASWRLSTDEHATPPAWLSFYPSAGVLRPGQSMKIWVLVDLNITTASDVISSESKKFEHIAVVEVINGSHFFCCINGSLSSDSFSISKCLLLTHPLIIIH